MRPFASGSRTKRGTCAGTGSSASSTVSSASRRSCSPIAKPPLAMNGNGCAGSIASGDRIGNTCSKKCVSMSLSSAPRRSAAPSTSIPSSRIARRSTPTHSCWRIISARASASICRSCSLGESPSALGECTPSRSNPRRPATRTE